MDSDTILHILESDNEGIHDIEHDSQLRDSRRRRMWSPSLFLSDDSSTPLEMVAASEEDYEELVHPDLERVPTNPYKSILVREDDRVEYTGAGPLPLEDGNSIRFYEERHFMPKENDYFMPINIGDTFLGGLKINGEYEIVRKLGYGGFGTVWLALWTSLCGRKQRYLVLKVLTKEASKLIELRENHEYEVFEDMTIATSSRQAHHPGYKHCMTLVDSFQQFSRHPETFGAYRFLVMEPCGRNLLDLRMSQPKRLFGVAITKRIIKQLLHALDYMHHEKGLIHGDLKPDNLLVSLKMSQEDLAELVENNPPAYYPAQIAPQLSDNPIVTIKSQPLPNLGLREDLANIRIKLNDYGKATSPDKVDENSSFQIPWFMAPEVVLGHNLTTNMDIWSVGCIMFEFLTGEELFDLWETKNQNVMDTLLASMIEQVGPFPQEFLARCTHRMKYFDSEGELRRVHRYEPQTIEERLELSCTLPYNDIELAARFVCRCLTIDPAKRPSARELLEDDWFAGVAI